MGPPSLEGFKRCANVALGDIVSGGLGSAFQGEWLDS